MKLSDYAKQVGVTYKTAYQRWKAGQLDAYQLPTGTIIVREAKPSATGVTLYARVASADQKADVTRQRQHLRDYAAARGYQVVAEVTEIASGLNDERPKLTKLLTDAKVGVIVVEHRDRLTRFGYGYSAALLEHEGRRVEAIYPSDTGNDLVDDFVAVITSMAAHTPISMAGATPSAGRRRFRRASNSVSSRQKRYEHHPACLQNRA